MVAVFPPSEGIPLDRAPEQAVAESATALRQRVIRDLAHLITKPAEGVSALDRVEAVRLLGQLGGPVARLTLAGILREGPHLRPPAVGRWLRDTALDTLLRDPDRAATDRLLTGYYRLDRRLLRGRLERNLVYDDIPTLLTHHRAGVLVRGYLLPLLGMLLIVPVILEIVVAGGFVGPLGILGPLLGALFFLTVGLGLFNLHQLLLVLLVAWAGARLPLLHLERAWVRGTWAITLVAAAFILSLLAVYNVLRMIGSGSTQAEDFVDFCLFLLPLLSLPCYMLAHDLEANAQAQLGRSRWGASLAVALRWASGILYLAFVLIAAGLNVALLSHSVNDTRTSGEATVLLGTYPALIYLALSPVLVLLVLAALGWIQRRSRGSIGGRSV